MPKFLHSMINRSGTAARVTDPETKQPIAHVKRAEGFWEATCAQTGKLLLPRIAHTNLEQQPKNTPWGTPRNKTEIPLGEILKSLRPVLCA